jgi:hypothetical protein
MKKYVVATIVYLTIMCAYLLFVRFHSDESVAFYYDYLEVSMLIVLILPGVINGFLYNPNQNKIKVLITSLMLNILSFLAFYVMMSIIFFNEGSGV